MKPRNWPLISYFGMIATVTLIGIVLPPEDRICSAVLLGKVAEQASTPVFGCLEFWLNRYQALAAAGVALGASIVTVIYLRKQIALADQQERDRIARRHAAERANLTLSLSDICGYAETSARVLKEMLDDWASRRSRAWLRTDRHPPVPAAALAQLQRFIESVSSPDHANSTADLIGEIQVHKARIAGLLERDRGNRLNLEEYIIDATEIYVRSSNLFDYARRRAKIMPSKPSSNDMKSALNIIGINFDNHDEITARIERRYPQGAEIG